MIAHITTRAAWQEAQVAGKYRHPSLSTDGFIHGSLPTEDQLVAVANAHFVGQPDLVLLLIDRQRLTVPVKDEGFEDSECSFRMFTVPSVSVQWFRCWTFHWERMAASDCRTRF